MKTIEISQELAAHLMLMIQSLDKEIQSEENRDSCIYLEGMRSALDSLTQNVEA
jgi:hypothetical protein